MKSTAKTVTLGLLVLLVLAAAACGRDPLSLEDATPQLAKGGSKGKPSDGDTDSSGDVTLVTYTVETATAPHGLTDDPTVDGDIFMELAITAPELLKEDWAAYLGCPDPNGICSKVTMVMTGTLATAPTWAVAFRAGAVPIVAECGGTSADTCLHDLDIVNRRRSTLRGGSAIPNLPWEILAETFVYNVEAETFKFTFYWQGQRGVSALWTGDISHEEKIRGKIVEVFDTEQETAWDLFPDLLHQGFPERFFFHPVFRTSSRSEYYPTLPEASLLAICDAKPGRCWAEYHGTTESYISRVVWVDVAPVTISGIKYLEFGVKAEVDGAANSNPQSLGRVMLTHQDGSREMLLSQGTRRIDDEDGTAATRYRVDVDSGGCYTFDVVGLVVLETQRETFREDNRRVWDGEGLGSLMHGCGA